MFERRARDRHQEVERNRGHVERTKQQREFRSVAHGFAHPEEAARLVNYLLNDPDYALLQGTEKGVLASKTARETLADNGKLSGFEEEATEQMQDHKDEMDPMVPAMEDADIISAFKDSLRKYEYGRADLSQSAQELYAAVQESNA